MTWTLQTKKLARDLYHAKLLRGTKAVSFREAAVLARCNPDFLACFTRQFKAVDMAAYFWETPPVATTNFDRPFEYVLKIAPTLAVRKPDPHSFMTQFNAAAGEIVTFRNLGGDALLLAPVPVAGGLGYAHLASFMRTAPETRVKALWRSTFQVLEDTVSHKPTWMSTSGLGVAWLHIRFDTSPKYYNYTPYRSVALSTAPV